MLSTVPCGAKSERMDSSVALKSKLPTKIFFTLISLCLRAGYSRRDEISGRVLRDGQTHPNLTSFPSPVTHGRDPSVASTDTLWTGDGDGGYVAGCWCAARLGMAARRIGLNDT